jgi:hypothetical protein
MRAVQVVVAYVLAVAVAAVVGSVVQAQFNLAEITAMGAPVTMTDRLATTLHDLVSFTPIFAVVIAGGFVIAFLVTAVILRFVPGLFMTGFTLAGAVAILVALYAMSLMYDGITPVAAARSLSGIAALALSGAVGGYVFALVARRRPEEHGR